MRISPTTATTLTLSITDATMYVTISWRQPPPYPTLFPYTTLFRSIVHCRRDDRDASLSDAVRDQPALARADQHDLRSEEHTSELQSRENLVCRLLLEKKNNWSKPKRYPTHHTD